MVVDYCDPSLQIWAGGAETSELVGGVAPTIIPQQPVSNLRFVRQA